MALIKMGIRQGAVADTEGGGVREEEKEEEEETGQKELRVRQASRLSRTATSECPLISRTCDDALETCRGMSSLARFRSNTVSTRGREPLIIIPR